MTRRSGAFFADAGQKRERTGVQRARRGGAWFLLSSFITMTAREQTRRRRGSSDTLGLSRSGGRVARRLVAASLALFGVPAIARAQEGSPVMIAPPGESSPDSAPTARTSGPAPSFAADVSATTLIPLSLGPELSVELPGRVLVHTHLGWMPELYSNGITGVLEDAGVYDQTVGALVDGAFQGATTWRLGLGWRPFPRAGLELGASYVRLAMDGSTTTGEIMRLVPPELAEQIAEQTGDVGLALDSTLHHFMLGVGWRWLIAERIVIRANLSYLQAFDSRSEIDIESFPALTRLTEPVVNGVLHDHYMRYVKIPVLGLSVGYRFF